MLLNRNMKLVLGNARFNDHDLMIYGDHKNIGHAVLTSLVCICEWEMAIKRQILGTKNICH